MRASPLAFLARRSPAIVTTGGILLVLVLGVVDYVTGPEISFSIFYVIPIAAVSWRVGAAAGTLTSAVAAASLLTAVLVADQEYTHPSIPYWNAFVRFGFFVILAFTLSSLRKARDRRRELRQFIVHDLRSPLANVMTGLAMLQEDEDTWLDREQKGFLEICMVSCDRMLTLINSYLDLSRLERGRMWLDREDVPASRLCGFALEQVRLWARQNGVRLEEIVPEDAVVHADVEMTVRVLVNLLGNAVKHAPEGSAVTTSVEVHEADVRFSVRDEGAGIPEEWSERIFDPYAQIAEPGEGKPAGSGLGLAFCRRAVEAQGGHIWMESPPGAGTTVIFTLPLGRGNT